MCRYFYRLLFLGYQVNLLQKTVDKDLLDVFFYKYDRIRRDSRILFRRMARFTRLKR